jgi:hypothetical protein
LRRGRISAVVCLKTPQAEGGCGGRAPRSAQAAPAADRTRPPTEKYAPVEHGARVWRPEDG